MKLVLSNKNFTIVDKEDYDFLKQWKWHEHGSGYAIRRVGHPGKIIWMHREINKTPEDLQTDHINRNRLDNRKSNLRSVTRSVNILNSKKRVDNTSGHKGVYWEKTKNRWLASICIDNKQIRLGRFKNKEDAIIIRLCAENQLAQSDVTRT